MVVGVLIVNCSVDIVWLIDLLKKFLFKLMRVLFIIVCISEMVILFFFGLFFKICLYKLMVLLKLLSLCLILVRMNLVNYVFCFVIFILGDFFSFWVFRRVLVVVIY